MHYRPVGKSGLKISEIALGSWVTRLADDTQLDVARDVVRLAYDNGVNFFDCADAYSGGDAERFLGDTLKQYPRRELVISSKVYFPTGDGVNDRGLSRKHIFESIDQTLKNLQTDYVDLYYCHRFDETCDLTETLRAMSDLVAQGKVLYYGVSEEWGGARLEEAQRIVDRYNLYPITVVQPQYNIVDRYIEHEIMGECRRHGIGITTFSPLAQGLLTGKYRKGKPLPAGSRATWQADHQINDLLTDRNLDLVEQLRGVADGLGVSLAVLSLAWILQHPEISCVIAGASKPSQLESNLAASGLEIPDDAMAEIDRISGFHRFERHVG
ncbi:aldo/keto reductase family protein [Bifidobacterium leontopitheci]|uniref:Voltage-gated potassium channel n=1 Tax=Bifidobacterium leontopitheci TaxID=2650774 RepID=A0A6I1GF50_9BIFI|nr:aldo/keto reductase family protein [Bifidobacterium leontopitheci]KAB7790254.1 voltage-gated potassium channel [Bifidobacterium leontopitheci]